MILPQEQFVTRIVDRYCLNRVGAFHEAWHIVLEMPQGFPSFRPGDSVGIYPKNSAEEIWFLQQYFQLSEDTPVALKNGSLCSFFTWLSEKVEIGRVSGTLLDSVAREALVLAERERLAHISQQERGEIVSHYTLCRFLREYVPGGVPLLPIVHAFPSLMPRLYSIASGPSQSKNGLEIILARVWYEHKSVVRRGVCSHYLVEAPLAKEATIRVFLHPTRSFAFPEKDASLIMVGAGTGIAPFRAYMQEVESRFACPQKCWLFFGERKSTEDFFYEDFWKKQMHEGRLKLHLAFSRDQDEKMYVQHRMWEERKELWRWLEEGAHFFVCGHAKKMAQDVESCLFDIACELGGFTAKQAEEWLLSMKQEQRYKRDVY